MAKSISQTPNIHIARIVPSEDSVIKPKTVHSKDPKNYNDNRKGIEKGLSFCSAPTLWHAQKWLREVKGQIVCVDYSCTATRGAYCHTLTDRETGGTLLVINLTPMNPLSPQVSNKH